jgi:hypothetical protein
LDLIEAYTTAPKSMDRLIVMIEQGVITIEAFDALNGAINRRAKLEYFLTASYVTMRQLHGFK